MVFYKYGVEVCNAMFDQYGGHWQKLANFLNVDYLAIQINDSIAEDLYYLYIGKYKMFFRQFFRRQSIRYDGWHHSINLVIIHLSWGGAPYEETDLLSDEPTEDID